MPRRRAGAPAAGRDVLLIGLDAASSWSKFGYAVGRYDGCRVLLSEAGLIGDGEGASSLDNILAPRLRDAEAALVAIDAPLGWPAPMAEQLRDHRAGQPFAVGKDAMFQRATDHFVYRSIGKKPLEIGADKIARAAHTALAALQQLRDATGKPIPLAWDRAFSGVAAIEVYPGSTLKAHGLPDSGYKKPDQIDVRRRIATALGNAILRIEERTDGNIDVFDACLCLMAAKDFLDGRASPPPEFEIAQREGWIRVKKPC
jgi:predicted nuclease with RNAse H fold